MARYFLVLGAVALAACSTKNIQNKDDVEKAVVEYLNAKQTQTGLDMNAMTIEVNSMSFEKDSARVGVYFKLKNSDGGMQMQYALERKGDKWVVKGLTGMGSGPHVPGTSAKAPGAEEPPQLPANHPRLDGPKVEAPPLPEGHPPVGSKQ